MVKFSAYILTALLCIIVFNSRAEQTSNPIVLTVKNKQIQYGKNFIFYLKINKNIKIDIATFLKPLSDLLNISIVNSKDTSNNIIYKIKASTRHIGTFNTASLKWKNFHTQPLSLEVTQPLSSNGTIITVSQLKTNRTPWEREQTRILIEITTKDKNIILNSKNIIQDGVESYQLKHSVITEIQNGETIYKHTIGWAAFFLYKQKTEIELPEVEYLKNSIPLYKFHFKKLTFEVKDLPIYISPTTPIGGIKLEARYIDIPITFMQPKSTAIIQYNLSAQGIPAKWLPSIFQLYNNNTQTNIQYSPSATKLLTTIDSSNIYGEKMVDIAFTPTGNGYAPFKNIKIQYFNPETGRLETLHFEHQKLLLLNWFLQILLFVFIAIVIFKLLISSIVLFNQLWLKYKYQRLFLRTIQQANTVYEIKAALKLFSKSENWPTNISIGKWLLKYRSKYYVTNNIVNAFENVNNMLYSKEVTDENSVLLNKNTIYKEVRNRKKTRKPIKLNLTYLFQYLPF